MKKELKAFVVENHIRKSGEYDRWPESVKELMEMGWGNGYVLIPSDHPYYGLHYDQIPLSVHGGLTYSDAANDSPSQVADWPEFTLEEKEGWVVGFDTAHYDDSLAKWPKEKVMEEAENLKRQLEEAYV